MNPFIFIFVIIIVLALLSVALLILNIVKAVKFYKDKKTGRLQYVNAFCIHYRTEKSTDRKGHDTTYYVSTVRYDVGGINYTTTVFNELKPLNIGESIRLCVDTATGKVNQNKISKRIFNIVFWMFMVIMFGYIGYRLFDILKILYVIYTSQS